MHARHTLVGILTFLSMTSPVAGQIVRWNGPANSPADWRNASNWIPTSPGATDRFEVGRNGVAELRNGEVQAAHGDVWEDATLRVIDATLSLIDVGEGGLGIGRSDSSDGTVELRNGILNAGRVIVARGRLRSNDSEVVVGSIRIGSSSQTVPTMFVPDGGTVVSLESGEMHADLLSIANRIKIEQSGGSMTVDRLEWQSGQYRLTGGELNVDSVFNLVRPSVTFDFANEEATINLRGAIMYGEFAPTFLNGDSATLNIDENSLIVLPEGADLGSQFKTVNNLGLSATRGSDLTISATRTIRGTGELDRALGRLTVEGELIGEEHGGLGGGLQIGEFTLADGGRIDIPFGGSFPGADSEMLGGSLNMQFLAFGSQGTFRQRSGDSVLGGVILTGQARYELSGGTLTVSRILSGQGSVDFSGSTSRLTLSDNAVLDLRTVDLLNANAATLTGGEGSLIIVPESVSLEEQFRTFQTDGVVYQPGQPLKVSANQELSLRVSVDDDVINEGLLSNSFNLQSNATTIIGNYLQTSTGQLNIDLGPEREPFVVSGTATLDGTLSITLAEGYELMVNDRITVLKAGSVLGTFRDLELPETLPDLAWRMDYDAVVVYLELVPRFLVSDTPLGDFTADGVLDVRDIDALIASVLDDSYDITLDLNGDGANNVADVGIWVSDLRRTFSGDANLDGEFGSGDLIEVFTAGEYEDDVPLNSGWAEGDWNADGDFTTGDLVVAFQDGAYEQGPQAAVAPVPEPSSLFLITTMALMALSRRRPSDVSKV